MAKGRWKTYENLDDDILAYLKDNEGASCREISRKVNVSWQVVKTALERLLTAKKVKTIEFYAGKKASVKWYLV